jgi:hypothetical protein
MPFKWPGGVLKMIPLTWRFVLERVTGIEPHYQLGKSVAL